MEERQVFRPFEGDLLNEVFSSAAMYVSRERMDSDFSFD